MSQISGPCCDSDIEPEQILYGKVVFTCKFTSSLKILKSYKEIKSILEMITYPENN